MIIYAYVICWFIVYNKRSTHPTAHMQPLEGWVVEPRTDAALPLWTATDSLWRRYLNEFSSPLGTPLSVVHRLRMVQLQWGWMCRLSHITWWLSVWQLLSGVPTWRYFSWAEDPHTVYDSLGVEGTDWWFLCNSQHSCFICVSRCVSRLSWHLTVSLWASYTLWSGPELL